MKGLFLCQRRFAVIANAIAGALKKKYNLNDFCAYVYSRPSLTYLQKHHSVNYTTLLLDEDIHNDYLKEKIDYDFLHQLEQEYGLPNLWPYLAIDRVVMYNQFVREYPYNTPHYTHEEMLQILQIKAKKILAMFEQEKPDFVFMSVVGAIGSMLLYHIAKKKNIKVFISVVGRIGNLFLLSENHHDASWADAIFEDLQKKKISNHHLGQAQKILADFQKNPAPYDEFESPTKRAVERRKQLKFLHPKNTLKSISWFFTFCHQYLKNTRYQDYDEIKPWHYLLDHTKRKIRGLVGYNDFYEQPDFKEDYAFFPLQLEPEISTLLFAPFYIDQIYVIKQIARSLPVHFKLYVKEHPTMVGYRPRRFYQELKKIPNVKLIPPNILSFPLIKNAKLITTITSTVGWEALFLGKPVITFGGVFFNKLSMVKKCESIEQLPYLIKEQLEKFIYNKEEFLNYLSAMLADGVDVPFVELWERQIDNIERIEKYSELIADLIVAKLRLTKN